MSNNKHTPGPWGVNPDRASEVRQMVGDKATGRYICDTSTVIALHPWRENARLIAAAPELDLALQDAERIISFALANGQLSGQNKFDAEASLGGIRAAIAKAKGEAP